MAGTITTKQPVRSEDYHYTESEEISIVTASTFQDKVTLTFTPPTTGYYLIQWTMEYSNNENNRETEVRLYNSTATTEEGIEQSEFAGEDVDRYKDFCGFRRLNLTAQQYQFILQFRRGTGGAASVRRARIFARRL
jgi:hypothetical protein